MKFTLISITRKVSESNNLEYASIPTKNGYITIYDNHEPLLSALAPWILTVRCDWKTHSYAIWWWVLEMDWKALSIVADMVEDWEQLDIEEIRAKKKEAKDLMEKYRSENPKIDMDYYIDLEMQFLKESAKEQLALR